MRIFALMVIAGALAVAYLVGRDLERMRTEARLPRDFCGKTRPWFV